MPIQPVRAQKSLPGEADIDRFATLFLPATPPATPTLIDFDSPPNTEPSVRSRKSTDSDFGAFVSVPPSQDPLSLDAPFVPSHNSSLVYFDQFTSHAKTAAERSRRGVLDELLEHQDDPLYFLNTHPTTPLHAPASPALSIPISTDDALAEALASDMHNPKLFWTERGGSVKVAPSPSRARVPLPPRLSAGSPSPPSISSPTDSSSSLPISSQSASKSTSASTIYSTSHPANATLSRLSSSLVSLLPSGRPRSTAPTIIPSSAPSSAPATHSRISASFASSAVTHGSPFASTPYIPPSGAPGFAGDRGWDHGFSDMLEQEEKLGLVDPVGLGPGAVTDPTTHTRRGKSKGITLCGRSEGTTRVLDEEMANLIRPHLPALMKLSRHWTLLYSIDQHGISLNTLYARCEPRIPSRAHPNPLQGGLLVIQDTHDTVFGVWLSEGIMLEKGGYYGSGESFLWRYHSAVDGERQGRVEVYPWTGKNAYVALCEPGFLSFGGGDGHYGLYVGSSLLEGSSAPCPTFGNPPLCALKMGQERNGVSKARADMLFECVGLEVWGIGQG